jgi:hypothetical protein
MASIISAGTTDSTSLNISGDKTGILQLASNNSTVAVTVDASQNVGIGTTAPQQRLGIKPATNVPQLYLIQDNVANDGFKLFADSSAGYLSFLRTTTGSDSEKMRIDINGNVGIGTTSPSTYGKLVSYAGDIAAVKAHGSGSYPTLVLQNATAGTTFSGRILWKDGNGTAGWSIGQNVVVGSGYLEFNEGASNRMAILPGGTVLINATSVASGAPGTGLYVNASIGAQLTYGPMYFSNENNTDNVGRATFSYRRGGTEVGFVSTTNSSTAYNTSSDYRLKQNILPMTGALANVALLKPITFKWKSTGTDGEGFIAHELAEICPSAVTGEKDAVETYTDEDGNEQTRPKYQAIDTSFLVATLTAAIQELKSISDTQAETINALTARLEALENN